MFDRRQAIKVIVGAAMGAALPVPAAAASTLGVPTRQANGSAPVLVVLTSGDSIIYHTELHNASFTQNGYGVDIDGDPVTFSGIWGRFDGARVVVLFAPDVVLAIPVPTVNEKIGDMEFRGDDLTLAWTGPAASIRIA